MHVCACMCTHVHSMCTCVSAGRVTWKAQLIFAGCFLSKEEDLNLSHTRIQQYN